MSESYKLTRIPSLKTVNAFQQHVESLGLDIPCEDHITQDDSPYIDLEFLFYLL